MSETPRGRHYVDPKGAWVVTITPPGTAEDHLLLLSRTLVGLMSMSVPAGRIGQHREASRALLRLGVAVTVREPDIESEPDGSIEARLRRFGSDLAGGRKHDRAALIETLHEAARRFEELDR